MEGAAIENLVMWQQFACVGLWGTRGSFYTRQRGYAFPRFVGWLVGLSAGLF